MKDLRVIAGEAKGRILKAVPGKGTRPTTDKVKESIFSMVGPFFDGGMVLDLFAGTGGLGIEALSRGINQAIFVDLDRKSVDVITENLQSIGWMDRAEVYRNEAARALKVLHKRGLKFDLVFLDPPYRLKNIPDIIQTMEEGHMIQESAIIVVEHDASHVYGESIGTWYRIRKAVYGDTAVSIYKKEKDSSGEIVRKGEGIVETSKK